MQMKHHSSPGFRRIRDLAMFSAVRMKFRGSNQIAAEILTPAEILQTSHAATSKLAAWQRRLFPG
jgi:hypothetical protein